MYPRTVEEPVAAGGTDAALLRALRTVQLSGLAAGEAGGEAEGAAGGAAGGGAAADEAAGGASGLDAVRDWSDELSLGEQQRLAFARVLVRRPTLAILDEATSALDLRTEAAMYPLAG